MDNKPLSLRAISYDFHIHSCLSPCSDDDMTPANIAGMAAIKELDVIAVTDHNTCRNCEALMMAAAEYGIMVIPGMELCTQEEIHVLCYFLTLEDAMKFDSYVYERLFKVVNDKKIFGNQLIYDSKDTLLMEEEYLLINGTSISFEEVHQLMIDFHGIMVPAHIDKASNSLISSYGFIPSDSKFCCFELANLENLHELRNKHEYLNSCKVISNSDAHNLGKINEADFQIFVDQISVQGIFNALQGLVL